MHLRCGAVYIVKCRNVGILWRDIRYALRALRKAPTFTAIAVLALGLGIGANTAIFSIADALLLKPIALPDMEHLLVILEQAPGQTGEDATGVSPAGFRDWQQQSKVLEGLTAYEWRSTSLTGEGIPESVQAYMVEPNFFSLCGAAPMLGRTFLPEENKPGNDGVVVLSAGLWKTTIRRRSSCGRPNDSRGRKTCGCDRSYAAVIPISAGHGFVDATCTER